MFKEKYLPRQILLAAISFFITGLAIQIWRIESLSATYDQALFLQELWNSSKGHLFQSSLSSQLSSAVSLNGELPSISYLHLGQHLNFLTLIGTPFIIIFGLWGLPILQIGLITAAGFYLWGMASSRLPLKLANRITISYFLSGTVIGPAVENFHDFCWYPLLGFLLIDSLLKEESRKSIFLSLLFLLIREDAGICLFSIGLWGVLRRKNIKGLCVSIMLIAFVYVSLMTNIIQASFDSSLSERFLNEKFGHLVDGKIDGSIHLLLSLISNPKSIIKALYEPPIESLAFLLAPSLPLALIPLFSIDIVLIVIIPLFVALISQGMSALSVTLRYVMVLIPGLYAGSILWLENHPKIWNIIWFRRISTFLIALGLVITLASNPNRSFSALVPDSFHPWVHISPKMMLNRGNIAKEAIDLIPKDQSISADTPLLPLLAQRRIALRFPENIEFINQKQNKERVEWILSFPEFYKPYMPLFREETQRWKSIGSELNSLIKDETYGIYHCSNGFIILKKGYSTTSEKKSCLESSTETK